MTLPRHPCTSERSRRRVVLLVEDEPFVRDATCQILQSAGFDVLPASDAHEAMDIYKHNRRKIDPTHDRPGSAGPKWPPTGARPAQYFRGDPDPVDVWLRGIRVRRRAARAQNLLPAEAPFRGRNWSRRWEQFSAKRCADSPPRTRANSEPNFVVETRRAASPPARALPIAARRGEPRLYS